MPDELYAASRWIRDILAADTTLTDLIGGASNPRIFQETAQQKATFPLVLIRTVPSQFDSRTASGQRVLTFPFFRIVAAIDKQTYTPINPIAVRLDFLLHGAQSSDAAGMYFACHRERPWRREFIDSGKFYREAGGDYKLEAHPI